MTQNLTSSIRDFMKRKIAGWLLVFLISFSGCSRPIVWIIASPTPTSSPTPIPTLTPTRIPSPTPTPTPSPSNRLSQAEQLILMGDYEQAILQAQQAMQASNEPETQADALRLVGKSNYLAKNYSAAIQSLQSIINQFPNAKVIAEAQYLLGASLFATKNYPGATQAYTAYLAARPGVIDAHVYEALGDAYAASGNYSAALSSYQAAINAPKLGNNDNLEIKAGSASASLNDFNDAIKRFNAVYKSSNSDFYKSRANYLMGETFLKMGLADQAYARFQESLLYYPGYYDTYNGLVTLVKAGIPVNELYRGLVNYYVGQYGLALDAFSRYTKANPQHDGSVHHYRALTLRAQNLPDQAIEEWRILIEKYPTNRFFVTAWGEIAYTQWAFLKRMDNAASTYLRFVELYPASPTAPEYLYSAARIFERSNRLADAAATWEMVINKYPSAANSQRALFLSGISLYRLNQFNQAKVTFQRCLLLASNPSDKAAAQLWIGKTFSALGNIEEAKISWEQAYQIDPTGYYSERARELYQGKSPFSTSAPYDLGYALEKEIPLAESWLRAYFSIPSNTDLLTAGVLAKEPRFIRGSELWQLGQFESARNEFESLRRDLAGDSVNSFRLVNHLLQLGVYRSAILGARQILDLAKMDDAATLTAPVFFSHTRFGLYYRDAVISAAQAEKFHPFLLFSVIRQESLFEGFAKSSAGAKGLMQIMPATGKEIAAQTKYPENYKEDDLNRPIISIRMGASYLARWRDYFNGDLYAALAAYNGGPGNTIAWKELAPNDPDLFLEVIRADESRQYIMRIFEFFQIYRLIYERIP